MTRLRTPLRDQKYIGELSPPTAKLLEPGFDLWLADLAGMLDLTVRKKHVESFFDSSLYGSAMRRHVDLNLHGRKRYDTFHGPLGVPEDAGAP